MVELLDLPCELVCDIVRHVDYPDSLSLKFTCKYFHDTIDHTVRDRVSWLLDRIQLGLPIPCTQKCDFKTDAWFCFSPEVRQILRNRRKHIECTFYGQGHCLIVSTDTCTSIFSCPAGTKGRKSSSGMMSTMKAIVLVLQPSIYSLLALLFSYLLYKL